MAAPTIPVAPTTMLLGPGLLIIGLHLRRLAMPLRTTVVRGSRFHVHHLLIGQARPLSSSLGSTRAHGRRTIVHKKRHKRGPRITVLRKIRR
jgi:hypothetical protein